MKILKYFLLFSIITCLIGCGKDNQSVSNTSGNKLSNYYWVSQNDYSYGFADYSDEEAPIVITNETNAFQFLERGKCYIATFNGNTIFNNGKKYNIKKNFNITKQGIWLSDIQECTWKVSNDRIYVDLHDINNTVLNGDYVKNKDSIEIIWNGEQRKDIYNKIKVDESLLFSYQYRLQPEDKYEYYRYDYDVEQHISNNTLYAGLSLKGLYNNIIQELNLDVTVEEFKEFTNSYLIKGIWQAIESEILSSEYERNSLEFQTLFASPNGTITSQRIEQLRGQTLKLYVPERESTDDEIMKKVANKKNVSESNIFIADDYFTTVTIYITDRETLKDYIELIDS